MNTTASTVDPNSARQVLAKCAKGIDQIGEGTGTGVYIPDAPNYQLVLTNGGKSMIAGFPGVVFGGNQLGFATTRESCSDEIWSEYLVWDAMIDELSRLVVKD